jgi:allophanate hydrolase
VTAAAAVAVDLPAAVLAARDRALACEQPAFTHVLTDAELAALRPGAGPLAGVPFVVKDSLDLAGIPTTGGCPVLTEPAAATATAVQRLLDAGAVPVAKANLDQFATGLVGSRSPYGACWSVTSRQHVSGGSSSGSAVAVATGVVPLALGTDTAGSGRVPAAFNGLVGIKPTRGLVSTRGLLPACRSLDCVTTLTRTVAEGRAALGVLAAYDPADPWSRRAPAVRPVGVARRMQVVGVPTALPDLAPAHRDAFDAAVARAGEVARLVPVDIAPLLEAARLLYEGPWPAERLVAVGHLLELDGPHLDPTVRSIVLGGERLTAADAFRGLHRLAELAAQVAPWWHELDALLLPVTPDHPTLAEVRADPVGANARLGTYTNAVNLLDLAAVAVPAGHRRDGLPFGVQFLAPAFSDGPLLDLAARFVGEPVAEPTVGADRALVAVSGAHLTGQPLNGQLVAAGGTLDRRARTAAGYRMYRVPGPLPRPGLVRTGDGPAAGIDVEVWDLPAGAVAGLLAGIAPPLALGGVELDDGAVVPGFLAAGPGDPAADITAHGGWRAYLASR